MDSSGSYPADVGVGQGSALSPVLSGIYLAPLFKLFQCDPAGALVDICGSDLHSLDNVLHAECGAWRLVIQAKKN